MNIMVYTQGQASLCSDREEKSKTRVIISRVLSLSQNCKFNQLHIKTVMLICNIFYFKQWNEVLKLCFPQDWTGFRKKFSLQLFSPLIFIQTVLILCYIQGLHVSRKHYKAWTEVNQRWYSNIQKSSWLQRSKVGIYECALSNTLTQCKLWGDHNNETCLTPKRSPLCLLFCFELDAHMFPWGIWKNSPSELKQSSLCVSVCF